MIRVGNWPKSEVNSYLDLYYGALEKHGIYRVTELQINDNELERQLDNIDVLHLHWSIESVWKDQQTLKSLKKLCGLIRYLWLAKKHQKKVVWTVHETLPIGTSTRLDRLGYRVVAAFADLAIFHSESSRRTAVENYGVREQRTVVMRHGNYDGIFPNPRSRAEIAAELGIDPDRPTLLCQGLVTPHKGFDLAIEAVKSLEGRFQVVIAGGCAPEYAAELSGLAAGVSYVRLCFRRLSAEEMSNLFHVCDAVLLPYRRVTASGSILTAFTLSRGVIATDLSYFRDLVRTEPTAATFCSQPTSSGIAGAIEEYFSSDVSARCQAARRIAAAHPWNEAVEPVVEWMQRNVKPMQPFLESDTSE